MRTRWSTSTPSAPAAAASPGSMPRRPAGRPASAGSEPGPACYGLGGDEPTVTDASVVLGYLDPEHFAGGRLKLRPELAARRSTVVAGPLGLTVEQAALGIHRIINAQMAEGIRFVSIRQGHDPRRFTLLPWAAAAPCMPARSPRSWASAASSSRAFRACCRLPACWPRPSSTRSPPRCPRAIDGGRPRGGRAPYSASWRALPGADGAGERRVADIARRYFADICYTGQAYHLEVPFEPDAADPFAALTTAFYAAHDRTYGYAPKSPVRLVNLRTVHSVAGATHLRDEWTPTAEPALMRKARILLPRAAVRRRGRGLRSRRAESRRHLQRPRHHRAGRHDDAGHARLALPGRCSRQSAARADRQRTGNAHDALASHMSPSAPV